MLIRRCRWTATRCAPSSRRPTRPRPTFPPLPVDLTERELEVLRLLAAGRTKRQIAGELFISQSTVHTHTVHIYAKCDVSTRAGLAMFAMRHGLAAAPTGRPRISIERSMAGRPRRLLPLPATNHRPRRSHA